MLVLYAVMMLIQEWQHYKTH
ncbi:hypothetical protein EVA_19372, partial [gut metagenome]